MAEEITNQFIKVRDYPTLANENLLKSNKTLTDFNNKVFPDYKYDDKGRLQYNNLKAKAKSKDAWAATYTGQGFDNGKINIYFADDAFDNKWTLFRAMGHEYVHLANYIELGDNYVGVYSEYAAYKWNALVEKDDSWLTIDYMKSHGKEFNPFTLDGNVIVKRTIEPYYMHYGEWGLYTFIPQSFWDY